jgi:hypothetical protein
MKKGHWFVFFAVLVVVLIAVLLMPWDFGEDKILFEKEEGWGPCPPEFQPCEQNTKLYYSGRLVFEGQINSEMRLSEEEVQVVVDEIWSSGVVDKDCDAPTVLDYYASYVINVDSKKKEIIFPGCEDELAKVEDLIPDPPGEFKGGA